MGKQAREQQKLEAMQAQAMDLLAAQMHKHMVQAIQAGPQVIRTAIGPTQGVVLTLLMGDGSTVGPLILDVIGVLNMTAAMTSTLVSAPQDVLAEEEVPTETASGIILP